MKSKNNSQSESQKKKRPVLSNTQNKRLGGLIAVLCGREPYEWILGSLVNDGYVSRTEGEISLTERGDREIDRLVTLSGLNVTKDFLKPHKAENGRTT
jgi:hypothetical protein